MVKGGKKEGGMDQEDNLYVYIMQGKGTGKGRMETKEAGGGVVGKGEGKR